MQLFDFLLVYTFAIYGISWLLTQSYLTQPLRDWLDYWDPAFSAEKSLTQKVLSKINYLFNCIVCTSAWVSFVISILISNNFSNLFYYALSNLDLCLLASWSISTTWFLANKFDDIS